MGIKSSRVFLYVIPDVVDINFVTRNMNLFESLFCLLTYVNLGPFQSFQQMNIDLKHQSAWDLADPPDPMLTYGVMYVWDGIHHIK